MAGKTPAKLPSRRRFLKWGLFGAAGVCMGGGSYALLEAGWLRVASQTIPVPSLPSAFENLRIALVSDVHHGPWTGLSYIRKMVAAVNELSPDLVALVGDYVQHSAAHIAPCLEELGRLRADLGVFAVLGNHDHWAGAALTRHCLKNQGIHELTNCGVWLARGGARLRLAGVGDLWEDTQDLRAALGDAESGEACILLSHNPDYAENLRDPRVRLMLSGHTHGGQVVLPLVGAPCVPSRYGQKYLAGLVQAPSTLVYVSRGVGTISPPLRFNCRPEINLLTLKAA